MTRMDIPATETGLTRVFHLDLPPQAVERFTNQAGTGEWPLQYGLGASVLRASFVEVVAIRDLGAMTLSTYLAEGYGLAGPDFKAARPMLDALRGHVVLLPSQAFAGTAQTLTVAPPLRWVGTFSEPGRPAKLTPLRSAGARGVLSGGSGGGGFSRGNSVLLKVIVAVLAVIVAAVAILALRSGT